MKRFMPSPAMVIALVALTVALSGTAYAAAKINGKNIKKGTVSSTQIKDKSILGKDIKDKTITGADIGDGTVGTADLADQAVDSAKIKDASVGAGDLATGAVPPAPIGTATRGTTFAVNGITFSNNDVMTLDYTAPAGTTKLIITYSAECDVSYTADAQYLSTRIVVDGTEAEPAEGVNYQFCTVDPLDGYNQRTGGTMTRVIAAGAGAHQIKVQAAEVILADGVLDDMTLTVVPSS